MRNVVDARGTAANFRVRQFHKFEIRDGAQERARSLVDLLPVEEVAGVLVGNAEGKWFGFGGEADGGEKFGDVFCFCGENERGSMFGFVGREAMIIFLKRGTTAGGIGEDGVEIFTEKCGDIFSGKVACDIANSRMRGERAAAELSMGHDDFAAVGGKNADSGFVESRKDDVGDAAGEKSDARATTANGGEGLANAGKEESVVDAWKQAFAIGETEKLENAAGASESLQAGMLIEAEEACDGGDARRKRK